MRRREPVWLRALGIVSALGTTKEETARRLFVGDTSGMKARDDFVPGRTVVVGEVSDELSLPPIKPELVTYPCRNNDLMLAAYAQIAAAVEEAVEAYGAARVGVVLGTSTTGIAAGEEALAVRLVRGRFPEGYHYRLQELGMPATYLAEYIGLSGPAYTISTACSSSARAFASGRQLLALGLCDAVIVGGVDSLCKLTLQGFASLGAVSAGHCNPMSVRRDGINIGEGAALFLMTRAEDGAKGIGLFGVGESSDAHHISAPDPTGEGAQSAMAMALADAGVGPDAVSYINLHGTGTELNDAMESLAVARLFGTSVPCSSTKPLVGHTLGAAGAIEAAFCWLALQQEDGLLPPHVWDGNRDPALPPIRLVEQGEQAQSHEQALFLSSSFAFGGNNCALLFGWISQSEKRGS